MKIEDKPNHMMATMRWQFFMVAQPIITHRRYENGGLIWFRPKN